MLCTKKLAVDVVKFVLSKIWRRTEIWDNSNSVQSQKLINFFRISVFCQIILTEIWNNKMETIRNVFAFILTLMGILACKVRTARHRSSHTKSRLMLGKGVSHLQRHVALFSNGEAAGGRSMLNEWRTREDGAGGPGRIATTVWTHQEEGGKNRWFSFFIPSLMLAPTSGFHPSCS
jgi:hypothetical protein